MEVRYDLNGFPVVLMDTAGLREDAADIVEEEGVKRAINAAKEADIVIFMRDPNDHCSSHLHDFSVQDNDSQIKLSVVNKIDTVQGQVDLPEDIIGVSGLTGQGMEEFLEKLSVIVQDLCQSGQDCPALTRERHRHHLKRAVQYLDEYLDEEENGTDLVICAHYLRKAVREIGFVSGKVSSDQILDVIFADFCIGK